MNKALFESLRPSQWIKNIIVFAALVFSQNLFNGYMLLKSALGFVTFCMLCSSIYLINDLMDIEKDKLHPLKSLRPLPSGRLSKNLAVQVTVILAIGSIISAFILSTNFGIACLIYFTMFCSYSVKLKKIVIVDVMTISLGFVLRVIAGAVLIDVNISNWLLLCTILLALFLALSKRRHELVSLDKNAATHRSILAEYSPNFLDQMIAVVTASTVTAYSLYTMSQETIEKFHTSHLSYTIPFVLYGIFRYLYLVHQRAEGGNPTAVLLTDRPLLLNCALWLLTVSLLIYF